MSRENKIAISLHARMRKREGLSAGESAAASPSRRGRERLDTARGSIESRERAADGCLKVRERRKRRAAASSISPRRSLRPKVRCNKPRAHGTSRQRGRRRAGSRSAGECERGSERGSERERERAKRVEHRFSLGQGGDASSEREHRILARSHASRSRSEPFQRHKST